MIALRAFFGDVFYQFRINGFLLQRLACVTGYTLLYEWNRLRGWSYNSSRARAMAVLSRLGASRRRVTIGLPEGATLSLDLLAATWILREVWSEEMYGRYPEFLPGPGMTVVDVGAHQGIFAVPATRRVGASGRVVAVEASPSNQELLARNKEANRLDNLTIISCAAGDFEGEAELYLSPVVSGNHSLFVRSDEAVAEPRSAVRVPVRTLDAILKAVGTLKVDLLKIDVEGAALNVLRGASETLASHPRLLLEVEGGDAEVRRVREHLEGLSYTVLEHRGILYAQARA